MTADFEQGGGKLRERRELRHPSWGRLLAPLLVAFGCPQANSVSTETPHDSAALLAKVDSVRGTSTAPSAAVDSGPEAPGSEAGSKDGAPEAVIAGLIRRRRYRQALEVLMTLSEVPVPERQLVRGKLLFLQGDWDGAGAAFAALDLARFSDSFRQQILGDQAVALARAGRCGDALPILQGAAQGGTRRAHFQAQLAECLRELARQNQYQAEVALEALRAVEGSKLLDGFAVGRAVADLQWQLGAQHSSYRKRAISTLRELLVARPEHPEAEAARQDLAGWTGAEIEFTNSESLLRAAGWIRSRNYDAALSELGRLSRPLGSRGQSQQRLHLEGVALFRTRHRYREAAERLLESAQAGGPNASEDRFLAGRAWMRAGDHRRAIDALRAFQRRYPRHRKVDEAEYLAAWLELQDSVPRPARAMRRLEAQLRRKRGSDVLRSCRWQLGLHALRQAAFVEAADWFAQTRGSARGRTLRQPKNPDPLVWGRSVYWEARAEQRAGHRDRAATLYQVTRKTLPLHWYGLWASRRLRELGDMVSHPLRSSRTAQASQGELANRGVPSPLPADVSLLHRYGFDREARELLRVRESEIRRARGLREVVSAYHRVGEFERPYRLVQARKKAALRSLPTADTRWIWEAACPRAYPAQVASAAQNEDVSPLLLWGVMRQESVFDPHALSYANAAGLLQLLPTTAQRLTAPEEPPARLELLFLPGVNLRLGARYLARLGQRFPLPLAVAAYNAGEDRVFDWSARFLAAPGDPKSANPSELDGFVERIPIAQTRNYVRRVVSHVACYGYLYGPKALLDQLPTEGLRPNDR